MDNNIWDYDNADRAADQAYADANPINHAVWSVSLDTQCPKCNRVFDVFHLPDYFEYIKDVDICQSDKEIDIDCIGCGHAFTATTTY